MLNKIKNNKILIIELLSLIAVILMIPTLLNILKNNINDSIIELTSILTAMASGIVILVYTYTKKDINIKFMILPVALLFGGSIASNVKNLIENDSWSSIYYITLNSLAIIIYALYAMKKDNKILNILYVVYAVILIMSFLTVISQGSAYSFGVMLIETIIIGNVYLSNNIEEEKE